MSDIEDLEGIAQQTSISVKRQPGGKLGWSISRNISVHQYALKYGYREPAALIPADDEGNPDSVEGVQETTIISEPVNLL